MATHTTVEGDMVDLICWRVYGAESGYVERVYDLNQGLADRGPILPAGVVIDLPDLEPADEIPMVTLWD